MKYKIKWIDQTLIEDFDVSDIVDTDTMAKYEPKLLEIAKGLYSREVNIQPVVFDEHNWFEFEATHEFECEPQDLKGYVEELINSEARDIEVFSVYDEKGEVALTEEKND